MSSKDYNSGGDRIERPSHVSSASSLDSFLMDLPEPSDFSVGNMLRLENGFDDETADSDIMKVAMRAYDPVPLQPEATIVPAQQQPPLVSTSLMMPETRMESLQLVPEPTSTVAVNNSIPEFLYQLIKMLTEDNRDVIEWTNGTWSRDE